MQCRYHSYCNVKQLMIEEHPIHQIKLEIVHLYPKNNINEINPSENYSDSIHDNIIDRKEKKFQIRQMRFLII